MNISQKAFPESYEPSPQLVNAPGFSHEEFFKKPLNYLFSSLMGRRFIAKRQLSTTISASELIPVDNNM